MTEIQEQAATAATVDEGQVAADAMIAEGSPPIYDSAQTQQAAAPTGPLITVGRVVQYTLNEYDAKAINDKRGANTHEAGWPKGAVAHFGNHAQAGDVLPLLVTKVWNEQGTINGQVFTDGNDTLWVTSVTPRPSPDTAGCHWDWPQRGDPYPA